MKANENDRADRTSHDPVLTIQDVSRLLQVPAPTIRSWERRYGIPSADRSEGGHRRYSPDQLTMLRRMRDEISRGNPAVQAAALVRAAQTRSTHPLIGTFLEAAHRLDPAGMKRVLDTAQATLGLALTVDEVLLPAMREIGRWWETGRCDVAHEHLATETTQTWLRGFARARPRARPEPVLLSCGPRDQHTLGLESLGALLGHRGFDCRLLGPRTPASSLAVAVQQLRPAAVVVVSHLSVARRVAVDALRAAQRVGIAYFYAGNAFGSPQSRRGVPGTYLGNNLGQAADLVADAIAPPAG
jgi:DNA-binding transcriptional MerR regulator/methylmalonyl-CoA mutase cobalamin-binding subunit